MIGRADIGVGFPTYDGLYAAEIYYGWKLLEWRKGVWWHPECVGPWKADVPARWVGPLPARRNKKPALEFDL